MIFQYFDISLKYIDYLYALILIFQYFYILKIYWLSICLASPALQIGPYNIGFKSFWSEEDFVSKPTGFRLNLTLFKLVASSDKEFKKIVEMLAPTKGLIEIMFYYSL